MPVVIAINAHDVERLGEALNLTQEVIRREPAFAKLVGQSI